MRSRRRRMIAFNVQYGTPMAGRCSVCNRLFEVRLAPSEALGLANERLMEQFDKHTCDEDGSQATAWIVRENSEK